MDDEDRARLAIAEAAAFRAILKRIGDLAWAPNHPHRRTVRQYLTMDLTTLTEHERGEITRLAWMYRRDLPEHLRPKLNPDDPIVREMAAAERGWHDA